VKQEQIQLPRNFRDFVQQRDQDDAYHDEDHTLADENDYHDHFALI